MNSGATYYSRDLVSAVGDNGEPLYYKSERDFSYFANNITIGVKFEKPDFSVDSYFAKGYLQDALSKRFILPYAKINYLVITTVFSLLAQKHFQKQVLFLLKLYPLQVWF